jgi:hypothetical protein
MSIFAETREVIRRVLEGKVLFTNPAIAPAAQHAFDNLKPELATKIADALNEAGLLRDDSRR